LSAITSDTIPGGVRPDDERVAAHSSQVDPTPPDRPSGHGESSQADVDRREAGQNR
jgi:hypothetical protein